MNYLSPTFYFDFENKNIQKLVEEFRSDTLTEKEKIIGLYLKVRDGWRYNPYRISLQKEDYQASKIVEREEGHCIDKAILMIAGARALGIPARIGLAKVKNHIAVEKLVEKIGTNELTPHGNAEVFLSEKWVKATPAFNKELCHLCHVAPLDFDGENDSIFQSYNESGTQFMEYLEDYGSFEDLPYEFILKNIADHYPHAAKMISTKNGVITF